MLSILWYNFYKYIYYIDAINSRNIVKYISINSIKTSEEIHVSFIRFALFASDIHSMSIIPPRTRHIFLQKKQYSLFTSVTIYGTCPTTGAIDANRGGGCILHWMSYFKYQSISENLFFYFLYRILLLALYNERMMLSPLSFAEQTIRERNLILLLH